MVLSFVVCWVASNSKGQFRSHLHLSSLFTVHAHGLLSRKKIFESTNFLARFFRLDTPHFKNEGEPQHRYDSIWQQYQTWPGRKQRRDVLLCRLFLANRPQQTTLVKFSLLNFVFNCPMTLQQYSLNLGSSEFCTLPHMHQTRQLGQILPNWEGKKNNLFCACVLVRVLPHLKAKKRRRETEGIEFQESSFHSVLRKDYTERRTAEDA